jgi:hypothetical protein
MPSRAVVWTLAILAIVLVVVPLVGMLAMGTCCGGMGMGGGMMGMHAVGVLWTLLGAAVVVALIVVLVRGVSRV